MKRTVIVPALVAALLAGATAVGCDEAEKVLGGEGAACESILDCQAELSCVATSASTTRNTALLKTSLRVLATSWHSRRVRWKVSMCSRP